MSFHLTINTTPRSYSALDLTSPSSIDRVPLVFNIQPLLDPPRNPEPLPRRNRATTPLAPRNRHAPLGSPLIHSLHISLRSWIDAHIDHTMQPITHTSPQHRDVQHRVVLVRLALRKQEIGGVLRQLLSVGVIRRRGLDSAQEGLVEVELPNVGNGTALDGVVGEAGGAVVDDCWAGSVTVRA